MQQVSCPSCGAPVSFRSHASVMAVCEYCHTSVLKTADAVKDMGKISAVLEDYSRIQIGTSGTWKGRSFDVVGRIQLRYEQGLWNEWYLLFGDGNGGWLGDSSGMYTLTTVQQVAPPLPDFHSIEPAQLYQIGGERFMASEKREAECIAGQGELPFRVGDGWTIRVADFRKGDKFVTLDYTDGEVPLVYAGQAVTLHEMQCQLLRDDDQIKQTAGRYRARLDTLKCPSCGSAIAWVPGVTRNLVCPACASQLDASSPQATVLAAGDKVEARFSSLKLGSNARINGGSHTVIGAMIRADAEGTEWTEYLAYSFHKGFLWLIETDDGWFQSKVLPTWPDVATLQAPRFDYDGKTFKKLYDYPATVRYAAGAFNWRVQAGDVVQVSEYENGNTSLAAEVTDSEITWSRSTPLSSEQLKTSFGDQFKGSFKPGPMPVSDKRSSTQFKFMWWILGLNAIPMFGGSGIFMTFLAVLAIFLPAMILYDKDS